MYLEVLKMKQLDVHQRLMATDDKQTVTYLVSMNTESKCALSTSTVLSLELHKLVMARAAEQPIMFLEHHVSGTLKCKCAVSPCTVLSWENG